LRLAQGAHNAELAGKFGLTSQQVQGVRMGVARKNTRDRDQQQTPSQPASNQTPPLGVSVEEVVSYLRQQDDVVVSAENGEFLVNARFKLALTDLVPRANRMRTRAGQTRIRAKHSATCASGKRCFGKWPPPNILVAQRCSAHIE
jgi:hypothetical protein